MRAGVVAIREFRLNPSHRYADYLRYFDRRAVGADEAKREIGPDRRPHEAVLGRSAPSGDVAALELPKGHAT
jgi:hypothetical protein